jgi:hypothetical protein
MRCRRELPVALLAFALGCGNRSTLDVFGGPPASRGDDATVGSEPAEAGGSSSGSGASSNGGSRSSSGGGTSLGGSGSGSSGSSGSVVRCEGGAGADVGPDAAACFIDLNQYDRSCSVDSDCVATVELSCAMYQNRPRGLNLYVRGGSFCDGCNCNTGAAINRSAVAQYVADVSRTPEGSGQVAFPVCGCPPTPPPTISCNSGLCGLSDVGH